MHREGRANLREHPMTLPPPIEPAAPHSPGMPIRTVLRWKSGTRIAFRFCFVYFGAFCLTTQILPGLLPLPGIDIDLEDPATAWPIRQIVFWTARHVFRVTRPLVYTGSGSGDKTFDWVLAFCLLVFAAACAGAWSFLDRKRENYLTLYKWFRVFIRFSLASQMILYGLAKLVPLQMPSPG